MGDFTVPYNVPRLDVTYDDYTADDRDSMVAGSSGNLYFNNYINGVPTAIGYSSVQVDLLDENGTNVASASTISTDSTGLYYVNLTVPVSAYKVHHDYRDR